VSGGKPGWEGRFIYATFEELKSGLTTDVYFTRTRKILQKYGLLDVEVHMEITASKLPGSYKWGVYAGLREVLKLLDGKRITVRSLPEGTVFHAKDYYGCKVPVMTIEGPYGEFLELETPLLGFLASASGIATKAARVKKAAGDKLVLSFGARRQHPALAPFVEFYAYIGGADAVSAVLGAEALGIRATGTMPHSLLIIFRGILGDHTLGWKAFDEVIEKDVNRVALVDTFYDEAEEALLAAKLLGEGLWGVRLDTPGSRRGNFEEIVREVRWKLDVNGYRHVKIVVSGGIDEDSAPSLAKAGADAFGVGAAIAAAQPIDFAMDITAMKINGEWKPIAKRGKLSGRKQVYRCDECFIDHVVPIDSDVPGCPKCGKPMRPLLETYIDAGKPVKKVEDPHTVRKYVLKQLENVSLT